MTNMSLFLTFVLAKSLTYYKKLNFSYFYFFLLFLFNQLILEYSAKRSEFGGSF